MKFQVVIDVNINTIYRWIYGMDIVQVWLIKYQQVFKRMISIKTIKIRNRIYMRIINFQTILKKIEIK